MRLIECRNQGSLKLTEDFADDQVPTEYAVLLHNLDTRG